MSFEVEVAKRGASTLVRLLKFIRGEQSFCYTSAGRPIVYGGDTYRNDTSLALSPVKVEGSSGISESLEIEVPANHSVAQLYRTFFPSTPVLVEVRLGFLDDPALDYKPTWTGRVVSCSFSESALAKTRSARLVCEPRLAVLNRNGLPYRYGSLCQHSVYRGGCDLSLTGNEFFCTVEALTGNVMTLTGISGLSGQFVAGLLLFGDGDWRDIVAQSGNVITIGFPIDGLVVGSAVRVYRGCNRTRERCVELGNANRILKFNIPTKNLFETGLK